MRSQVLYRAAQAWEREFHVTTWQEGQACERVVKTGQ